MKQNNKFDALFASMALTGAILRELDDLLDRITHHRTEGLYEIRLNKPDPSREEPILTVPRIQKGNAITGNIRELSRSQTLHKAEVCEVLRNGGGVAHVQVVCSEGKAYIASVAPAEGPAPSQEDVDLKKPTPPSPEPSEFKTKHDPVNNPKHYDLFPDGQSIDIIKSALTPEEFRGFLKGNCLKYRIRAGSKDDLQQDINKANWYKDKLWEVTKESDAYRKISQVIDDTIANGSGMTAVSIGEDSRVNVRRVPMESVVKGPSNPLKEEAQ